MTHNTPQTSHRSARPLSRQARLRFAAAVATAGLAVAVTILLSGASAVQYLPPPWMFCLGALFGAGVAGWLSAGAFGRPGWLGGLFSAGAGFAMTCLGAEIGAFWVLVLFGDPQTSPFLGFGLLTLAMSVDAPGPVLCWLVSMALLHMVAERLRSM